MKAHNSMTQATARLDLLWCSFAFCILLLIATVLHMQLTMWSDHVGFSSNHEFYFNVRHPVRAMVRDFTFFAGLVGVGVGLFLLWRRSRYAALQGLLVIAGACISVIIMIMLLILVFTLFALLRGGADVRNVITVLLQMLPSVAGFVTISMLFKRIRKQATRLRWCFGVSMALLGAQGIWLLNGGSDTFLMRIAICIAVLATVIVLALSNSKSCRNKAP